MRSAALLSLLIILALRDGVDCQSFKDFQQKHILPNNFKTKNAADWMKYLWDNNLCERTEVQSFIKSSENNIEQICKGSGIDIGNYTESTNFFQVYIVKSTREINECTINSCTSGTYNVFVKCEKQLPVHYHVQSIKENTRPQPCFQRA